jgi:putative DNA primase/helicase
LSAGGHLEVYDTDRYFVLTGDVYDGFTSVECRPSVVRAVQDKYLPARRTASSPSQQKPLSEQEFDDENVDATPEEVRRTIREYGASGRTSVDGDAILRLWDGSDVSYSGDTSRADMAFVKHLYFWCKGDQQLMDDCFRASGRMRPKWDEVHSSDGATYGEMTIRKVCRTNSDTFGGGYVEME